MLVFVITGRQWHLCNRGQTGSGKVAVSSVLVRNGTWQVARGRVAVTRMFIGAVAGWQWHVCPWGQLLSSSCTFVDGDSGRETVTCVLVGSMSSVLVTVMS